MKLTILDGHGLNPGDLSWEAIKSLTDDFSVFERTPAELVAERIGNSEMILLNKVCITSEILEKCPNLKYIGVLATGFNVIDLQACRSRGITVTNIPSYSTDAVAQHVFAFILNFANSVQSHCDSVMAGDWIKAPDFCYWKNPLTELAGKTLGIFGFGHIGQKTAQIGHAFGMNVIVHVHSEKSFTGGEKTVSVEEIFAQSDFLTFHTPLTKETEKIINKKNLSLMKKTAIIINTARGGLVDEADMREALLSKTIAGYGTDVLLKEPMDKSCPLFGIPGCVITPHIAWAPQETRSRLMEIAAANIKAFLAGTPQNVVN